MPYSYIIAVIAIYQAKKTAIRVATQANSEQIFITSLPAARTDAPAGRFQASCADQNKKKCKKIFAQLNDCIYISSQIAAQ